MLILIRVQAGIHADEFRGIGHGREAPLGGIRERYRVHSMIHRGESQACRGPSRTRASGEGLHDWNLHSDVERMTRTGEPVQTQQHAVAKQAATPDRSFESQNRCDAAAVLPVDTRGDAERRHGGQQPRTA